MRQSQSFLLPLRLHSFHSSNEIRRGEDVCANSSFGGGLEKWPPTQEWFVKCRAPWLKAAEGTREFTMAGGVGL